MRSIFAPMLAGAPFYDRLATCAGAVIGITLTAVFTTAALGEGPAAFRLVAPMGASAVPIFAVPASPLAQPWAVIGGNVITALVGVAVASLVLPQRSPPGLLWAGPYWRCRCCAACIRLAALRHSRRLSAGRQSRRRVGCSPSCRSAPMRLSWRQQASSSTEFRGIPTRIALPWVRWRFRRLAISQHRVPRPSMQHWLTLAKHSISAVKSLISCLNACASTQKPGATPIDQDTILDRSKPLRIGSRT